MTFAIKVVLNHNTTNNQPTENVASRAYTMFF